MLKGGGESCVFYQPHFQMLRPTSPPPPYFLTSPLHDLHSACIKCRSSRKTVKLIQKLSPGKELRAPVQRLALSLEKQAGV